MNQNIQTGENTPGETSAPQTPSPTEAGTPETKRIQALEAELAREKARASTAQQTADLLTNKLKKFESSGIRVDESAATLEPSHMLEIVSSLNQKILAKPEYQEVILENPLLAKIVSKKPWELLDTTTFATPQDLVEQVVEKLDDFVLAKLQKSTPANQQESKPSEPEAPAPQPSNPNPSVQQGTSDPKKVTPRFESSVDRVANSLVSRIRVR